MVKLKVQENRFRIEERLRNGTVFAAADYPDQKTAESGYAGWLRFVAQHARVFGVPNPLVPNGDRRLVLLGPDRTKLVRPVVDGPAL